MYAQQTDDHQHNFYRTMLKQSRRLLQIFSKERQSTDLSSSTSTEQEPQYSTTSTSPLTSTQSPDPSPRLPRSPFSPAVRQYSSVGIDDDVDDVETTIDFVELRHDSSSSSRGSMNPLNSA